MSETRVLIVDDDENLGKACARIFGRMGHEAVIVRSGPAALEELESGSFDLVLSDLVMPRMDGIELLKQIRRHHPELPFILMTGYGTIQSAVAAMKEGATNYITKPFDRGELEAAVRAVLTQRELVGEVERLKVELDARDPAPELVGVSSAMQTVKELIRAAARTTSPAFIHGESGTGKEMVARAIHVASERRSRPFVPVNCGALPEGLAESELFGNVKGAFTGAGIARTGLFRSAEGGTLFLDEIGEMAPDLQVKLLRALQERAVRPVGGVREVPIDVRVVAATNQPPPRAIAEGRLREDLYYRLAVLVVEVVPLRERPDDVEALAVHLLAKLRERYGEGPSRVSADALQALRAHSWPGNVRELENLLDRSFALGAKGDELGVSMLPPDLGACVADPAAPNGGGSFATEGGPTTLKEGEAMLIRKALAQAKGNKTRAAKALGISRPLLYKRIREYDIET